MRRELTEKLFSIEPSFFNRGDIQNSLMCFGFECGDGWYPLVDLLVREAKHRKDHPRRIPNEGYVSYEETPDIPVSRPPLPCLPDTREGWLQDPIRVEREVYEGEFSHCPYISDSRSIRSFTCVGGRVISKGPTDGPDYKGFGGPGSVKGEDLGECPGCEGGGKMVHYQHKCENEWNHFEVVQVKEKYGGLRFYTNFSDEHLDGMIEYAEGMSTRICEVCGAWATLVEAKGWYTTLCDSCRARDSDEELWKMIRKNNPIFPDWEKEDSDEGE